MFRCLVTGRNTDVKCELSLCLLAQTEGMAMNHDGERQVFTGGVWGEEG